MVEKVGDDWFCLRVLHQAFDAVYRLYLVAKRRNLTAKGKLLLSPLGFKDKPDALAGAVCLILRN